MADEKRLEYISKLLNILGGLDSEIKKRQMGLDYFRSSHQRSLSPLDLGEVTKTLESYGKIKDLIFEEFPELECFYKGQRIVDTSID